MTRQHYVIGACFFQVLQQNPIRAAILPSDQEFPTSCCQCNTMLATAVLLDEAIVLLWLIVTFHLSYCQ